MLRKFTFGLPLVMIAVLAVAPAAMAAKVNGTMDLAWNGCYEAPGEQVPDWIGTIEIDGDEYDMLFFNVGTGWPAGHAPEAPLAAFNELWAVYDDLELVYDEACATERFEGDLVLWGRDAGTANLETAEYQMVGTVVEAVGPFDGLAGERVAMSGTIVFGEEHPELAPGVFTIE